MAGLCFFGTIDLTQHGIQSIQGALFIIISENTFSPMYSVLSLFPHAFPLFMRERRSGLYDTVQYYISHIAALVGFGETIEFRPRGTYLGQKCRQACGTIQSRLTSTNLQIPGLMVEPFLFTTVGYWLAGLRPTFYAFSVTTLIAIMVMNVATACGCFFSIAFNSVPVAIAYLVPFDVILMVTSGVFIRLG